MLPSHLLKTYHASKTLYIFVESLRVIRNLSFYLVVVFQVGMIESSPLTEVVYFATASRQIARYFPISWSPYKYKLSISHFPPWPVILYPAPRIVSNTHPPSPHPSSQPPSCLNFNMKKLLENGRNPIWRNRTPGHQLFDVWLRACIASDKAYSSYVTRLTAENEI